MGGRGGWGLIVSTEANELDVVTDQVKVGIESKVVVSYRTLETASEGVYEAGVVLYDLVRGGDDAELRGVLDGEVNLFFMFGKVLA